jgi:hypothetical protein
MLTGIRVPIIGSFFVFFRCFSGKQSNGIDVLCLFTGIADGVLCLSIVRDELL